METKLKYIQFANGIELISEVDSKDWENTNHIKLYDPYRLYPIPPFLNPDESAHQTLILIKWLPWTDDLYINIMTDNILVITDVSTHMQEYYKSSIQKTTEESIEREFRKIEEVPEPVSSLLDNEPTNLEELSELLNDIVNKTKKVVH